jgi:hypothetical protein
MKEQMMDETKKNEELRDEIQKQKVIICEKDQEIEESQTEMKRVVKKFEEQMSQFRKDWSRFKRGYDFTYLFSSPCDFPQDDFKPVKESVSSSGKEITVNRVQATYDNFSQVVSRSPDIIHLSIPSITATQLHLQNLSHGIDPTTAESIFSLGPALVFEDSECRPKYVH